MILCQHNERWAMHREDKPPGKSVAFQLQIQLTIEQVSMELEDIDVVAVGEPVEQ